MYKFLCMYFICSTNKANLCKLVMTCKITIVSTIENEAQINKVKIEMKNI